MANGFEVNLKFVPADVPPKDEEIKLVLCRTQKGVFGTNRAYYANGSWHGSGSMSSVFAYADLAGIPCEKIYEAFNGLER
jgi:hypothetical protein